MRRLNLGCIIGTRPNIIKMAPILKALESRKQFTFKLVHTGQHTHVKLTTDLFRDLKMMEPDYTIRTGSESPIKRISEIMTQLEKVFVFEQFDAIIITGDVDSTMAAALTAYRNHIPIIHVEAGLRSHDIQMPEELNRIIVDRVSSLLMVSEPSGLENLKREGISPQRMFFVGNVMIDTLIQTLKNIDPDKVCETFSVEPNNYGILTIHRPENVDQPTRLKNIINIMNKISEEMPIIFPVHPRTQKTLETFSKNDFISNRLWIVEPLSYSNMIGLLANSQVVFTDSGGIQEETTFLNIPCITLRNNTERPITTTLGTNHLTGHNLQQTIALFSRLKKTEKRDAVPIPLWDGQAAIRIVDIIAEELPDLLDN